MTLITIAQAVAPNIGISRPSSVAGNDPDAIKIVQFANETGCELIRRVDWASLTKRHTINGTGNNDRFSMPPDFDRLSLGMSVSVNGNPVRGGVSADEWFSLTPSEGVPRYFRMFGNKMELYPYPAVSQPVFVSYQSKNWVESNAGEGKAQFSADNDVAVISEQLIQRGAIWRFLRHAGKDFGDHMSEYEAMLSDIARSESAERSP